MRPRSVPLWEFCGSKERTPALSTGPRSRLLIPGSRGDQELIPRPDQVLTFEPFVVWSLPIVGDIEQLQSETCRPETA